MTDPPPSGPTAPMALWLALQLAAVLVAVLRVPLSAQYPEPAEQMALYPLSGTQVVAAALLFPFLLRDGRCAGQAVASALPFLLGAGFMAGVTPEALIWPAASVAAWLVTLALWAPALQTSRARMIGIAVASLLTLGGGTLRYLRLEFAAGRGGAGFNPESASPLLSTWANLAGSNTAAAWVLLAVLALAAIGVRVANRPRRSSQPMPTPAGA